MTSIFTIRFLSLSFDTVYLVYRVGGGTKTFISTQPRVSMGKQIYSRFRQRTMFRPNSSTLSLVYQTLRIL